MMSEHEHDPIERMRPDSAKAAFARRLRTAMAEQNLGVAEVARRIQEQLPEGESFNPANLSHYRSGRSMPRPRIVEALSRALGMELDDLLSNAAAPNGSSVGPIEADALPAFHIEDREGQAWIQINQQLPWPVVIEILKALKGQGDA